MVSALASMECRPSKPFPELAILDSGAQVSIFNDELFFDESKTHTIYHPKDRAYPDRYAGHNKAYTLAAPTSSHVLPKHL